MIAHLKYLNYLLITHALWHGLHFNTAAGRNSEISDKGKQQQWWLNVSWRHVPKQNSHRAIVLNTATEDMYYLTTESSALPLSSEGHQ